MNCTNLVIGNSKLTLLKIMNIYRKYQMCNKHRLFLIFRKISWLWALNTPTSSFIMKCELAIYTLHCILFELIVVRSRYYFQNVIYFPLYDCSEFLKKYCINVRSHNFVPFFIYKILKVIFSKYDLRRATNITQFLISAHSFYEFLNYGIILKLNEWFWKLLLFF